MHVAFLRHWSYAPNDKKVWFAVYSTDGSEASSLVNAIFDNTGNVAALPIEIRPLRKSATFPQVEASFLAKLPLVSVPADYSPDNLEAFTYVYGMGEDYIPSIVEGRGRRRVGSTDNTRGRDFTVFNINWHTGRLQAGSTYTNHGYYFAGSLGNVQETAANLRTKVAIDQIELEEWSPQNRHLHIKLQVHG